MSQTITMADVRRGWIDCQTCGDTLRIFYHNRCPTCHTEFTVPPMPPATEPAEQDSTSETDTKGETANDDCILLKLREVESTRSRKTHI